MAPRCTTRSRCARSASGSRSARGPSSAARTSHRSISILREDKPARLTQLAKNYDFFGAPAAFFFPLDRQMGPGQWSHLGMLMQSIALVAEAKGLVACMQESWMTRHTFGRRFFAIPDELQVYCGMAVGYADAAHPINS